MSISSEVSQVCLKTLQRSVRLLWNRQSTYETVESGRKLKNKNKTSMPRKYLVVFRLKQSFLWIFSFNVLNKFALAMLSLLSFPISTSFWKMYIIYPSPIYSTLSFYVTEKACSCSSSKPPNLLTSWKPQEHSSAKHWRLWPTVHTRGSLHASNILLQ